MVALIPLCVLAMVLLNVTTWRRPRPDPEGATAGVRVCIPARNEALRIGPVLRAVLPQAAVTVLDDGSTDDTAALGRSLGATVLDGEPLPDGWIGKVWALEQLRQGSHEALLVFIDADVELAPGAVATIAAELDDCDVFTAMPYQRMDSFAERLLLPLLQLTYSAWLPLALVERVSDPRVLAANGQVMAMRRSTLEALGGFSAIRGELVDDMAFTRLAKSGGLTVRFADGHALAATRMYSSAREVADGFSKNLLEGVGSPLALLGVGVLYFVAFVLPYPALLLGGGLAAYLGVLANLLLRGVLALRHGHSLLSVLLHPVAVVLFLAVCARSWWWSRQGTIRWAGRSYGSKAQRNA